MHLVISLKSNQPIYEQLFEQIASQILSGELHPGELLPSIRSVAKDLGISIITIKKAWELLEEKRFIFTKQGVGCFVTKFEPKKLKNKKRSEVLERLSNDLKFYKQLGLSLEELLSLIREEY